MSILSFVHTITRLTFDLSLISIVGEQAPVANFSAKFQSVLGFSDSQIKSLQASSESCGYASSSA